MSTALAYCFLSILTIREIDFADLKVRISPARTKPSARHNEKAKRLIKSHLAFFLVTPVGLEPTTH